MHIYDDVGEVIVHKISTPLAPKFNDLKKEKKNENKRVYYIVMSYPICPFRVELIHSTNRRRVSSRL